MKETGFEVTRDGIKFSYERFLSDSAGGYLLAFVCVIAYLTDAAIPFSSETWGRLFVHPVSSSVALLLGLFIVLLGTPVGFMINAISWFTLGWVQIKLIDLAFVYYRWSFLLHSSGISYDIDLLRGCFEKDAKNHKGGKIFYKKMHYLEAVFRMHFPNQWNRLSDIEGVSQFMRKSSFIFFSVSLYSILIDDIKISLFALVIALIMILFSSTTRFYMFMRIFYNTILICKSYNVDMADQSIEDIANNLMKINKDPNKIG